MKKTLTACNYKLYLSREIILYEKHWMTSSLFFPAHYDRLAELGARYHRDELLLMLQGIEQLSQRMSTTLPERQVLEDAFREMIF